MDDRVVAKAGGLYRTFPFIPQKCIEPMLAKIDRTVVVDLLAGICGAVNITEDTVRLSECLFCAIYIVRLYLKQLFLMFFFNISSFKMLVYL
jgi:hypothetical protein